MVAATSAARPSCPALPRCAGRLPQQDRIPPRRLFDAPHVPSRTSRRASDQPHAMRASASRCCRTGTRRILHRNQLDVKTPGDGRGLSASGHRPVVRFTPHDQIQTRTGDRTTPRVRAIAASPACMVAAACSGNRRARNNRALAPCQVDKRRRGPHRRALVRTCRMAVGHARVGGVGDLGRHAARIHRPSDRKTAWSVPQLEFPPDSCAMTRPGCGLKPSVWIRSVRIIQIKHQPCQILAGKPPSLKK